LPKERTAGAAETARDTELIASIRRGDTGAIESFVTQFHRILHEYARRTRLLTTDQDEFIVDVLNDVVLRILKFELRVPDGLRVYVITVFLNRSRKMRRNEIRHDRLVSEAARSVAVDCGFADDEEVAAGCSHSSVRESRGPGWETAKLSGVLERLSHLLSEKLQEDERQLLSAVAENVPQRVIAEWLDIPHDVARKRLQRLRARLNHVAMQYANTLDPNDARELSRFFRRCRARVATADVDTGSDGPRAREA
jgi:DNA-directed RNA polymerase specialized sigma24 family protein